MILERTMFYSFYNPYCHILSTSGWLHIYLYTHMLIHAVPYVTHVISTSGWLHIYFLINVFRNGSLAVVPGEICLQADVPESLFCQCQAQSSTLHLACFWRLSSSCAQNGCQNMLRACCRMHATGFRSCWSG